MRALRQTPSPARGPRASLWIAILSLAASALTADAADPGAPTSPPQIAPAATTAPAPTGGRALAERYCTACHLFPEPALLPKTAWVHHVQPEMAKWLGLEPAEDIFTTEEPGENPSVRQPGSPVLSEADWFAIWDYYRAAAPSQAPAQSAHPATRAELPLFRARPLNPLPGVPSITLTRILPASRQLQVADAFQNLLLTLDPAGTVVSRERFSSPPVHLLPSARRSYVTLIGHLFPSDAPDGAVLSLPNPGPAGTGPVPPPKALLEKLRRPTEMAVADLNQDGREDLAVCQFGHRLGRFSWFENSGEGSYTEHVLLDRPGAIAVRALDFTGDGRPDLLVLTGQAREGLYLFVNQGRGVFRQETLLEKPPSWGFAGLELLDVDRDGRVDVLTVNGDNGDLPLPPKAFHGLRLYRNEGGPGAPRFTEVYFYPMHGAYKALARDFDGDGDPDIAAIAFYPDFAGGAPESFVYLENQGGLRFVPRTLPEAARGRWMTMDAGDLDGDGDDDLALGSFIKGPSTVPVPAGVRDVWRTNGAAVLILQNQRR